MKRGFYTIMSAQFLSSLADNALFVAAVQLLRSSHAPQWQQAALVPLFALFYVVLAPFGRIPCWPMPWSVWVRPLIHRPSTAS